MRTGGSIRSNLNRLDRKTLSTALLWALIALGVLWVLNLGYSEFSAMKKSVSVKRLEVERFRRLRGDYLRKKVTADSLVKRALSQRGRQSTVAILEGLGADMGVKERISSIKPIEEKEHKGYRETGVEVRIEGISLNQLVNLLYSIENHGALLIVKEFSMKSRFDESELYDIAMKIVQVSQI